MGTAAPAAFRALSAHMNALRITQEPCVRSQWQDPGEASCLLSPVPRRRRECGYYRVGRVQFGTVLGAGQYGV
jgi:hypothetical protein